MSEVLDTARKQGLHDRIVPVDCDVTLVAQGWGRIVNHQPFHHGDGRIFALRAVEGRARSRDRDLG
jgi:hypothetical protein